MSVCARVYVYLGGIFTGKKKQNLTVNHFVFQMDFFDSIVEIYVICPWMNVYVLSLSVHVLSINDHVLYGNGQNVRVDGLSITVDRLKQKETY